MTPSSLLLISLLAFTPASFGQEPTPGDDHAADRATLREIGGRYEQANNQGNLLPLAPFVAASASAVFATNDEVQGLDAIQKYFESIKKRLGENSSYAVALDPDRTEFFGNIALAHGRSNETAKLGNGREYRFTTHWTAVLRKDADGWKALRLHVSMDPFENPAIAARLQVRTILVAAIGVAVAVAAFLLGRMKRRT